MGELDPESVIGSTMFGGARRAVERWDKAGVDDESGRRLLLLELNGKAPRDDGEGSISELAEPFRLGLGGINRGVESLDASLGVNE